MATLLAMPVENAVGISVMQAELDSIAALRSQIAKQSALLSEKEAAVIAMLSDGASVEDGRYTAAVKIIERRNVSWREVVERLKGVGYAENVLQHTKPTPGAPKLVIR